MMPLQAHNQTLDASVTGKINDTKKLQQILTTVTRGITYENLTDRAVN